MQENKNVALYFDLSDTTVKEVLDRYTLIKPLLDINLLPSEKRTHREDVCRTLGISERTLRRYVVKLREKGFAGLIRKRRCDAGKYRVFSTELLEKAKKLLDENSYRSLPMVWQLLQTDEILNDQAKNISQSTLYHHVKKSGYNFKNRNKDTKIYHRFEAEYPNKLWQGDARHGIFLPDPMKPDKWKRTYLFAWVDDFSRKIIAARYYWDEKLPRLEDCFKRGVLRWGIPEKLYCDNGSVYISKQFDFIVKDLDIDKIHHPPYCAWCKGKIENRMKRFLVFQKEAELAGIKTLEELNATLTAWIDLEINKKKHTSTGEVPDERFWNNIEYHPIKRITDLDAFEALFFWRKPSTVNKYGKIQFKKNQYPVKGLAGGSKVEIRYDPFDLSEIHLYHDGKYYSKLIASLLNTPAIEKIPEEKPKEDVKISRDSVRYFEQIRKKYNENLNRNNDNIRFANIINSHKEEA